MARAKGLEHLPGKHKALSLNPSTTKNNNKKGIPGL
jgi:hypothetical protein